MPLRRCFLACFLSLGLLAWPQEKEQKEQKAQKAPEPPEEDESYATKEYSFNPLQAAKELKVSNFYFKKGNYSAAAARFKEATKWNEGYSDAYLRLGEALEKWKGLTAAKQAYEKYLELEPNGKQAKEIRKKLAGKA